MKRVWMIVAVLLLAGCIGPATERLEKLGISEDLIRTQLVEAAQAGDEATADTLREVLESYAAERTQLMAEATKERESARQRRGTIWSSIMGGVSILGSLAFAAAKRMMA